MNLFNTTGIDKKTYVRFQIFRSGSLKRIYIVANIAYAVILFAAAVTAFVFGLMKSSTPLIFLGIAVAVVLFGVLFSKLAAPGKKFDKQIKKTTVLKYHFYPKSFKIINEGQSEDEINALFYSDIYRLYETSDAFYIYYSKKVAFLVNKSGFSEKDLERFSAYMREAIGKKYIKALY